MVTVKLFVYLFFRVVALQQAQHASIPGHILLKLNFWTELPWMLCALAHPSGLVQMQCARRALQLWERGGPGILHQQSKRFLSPQYGSPSDPGLRPLVQRLADGETMEDIIGETPEGDLVHMFKWVAAFRHVPWLPLLWSVHESIARLFSHSQVGSCTRGDFSGFRFESVYSSPVQITK